MPNIQLKFDGQFMLATGRSRKETNWQNRETSWGALVNKVSVTHRTAETVAEYSREKKPRQDEIKDIGGFVGGYVNRGRRKNGSINFRQLVTLDIDFGKGGNGVMDDWDMLYGNAALVYSTHKHTPASPRLRLIIPLDREVNTDEYEAIARRVAGDLGIDIFDDTTFQPTRLMYWPSTPKDGEYVFKYVDAPWLSADAVLKSYRNWQDASEWPVSSRADSTVHRDIKRQDDPLEKPGIVGAWCRTYDIHEVIDMFLGEMYEPCDVENRYSYKGGSTSAGLVVYDDKFAYSHHGTDPISGKLCNAFDLVRLHLFGLKDDTAREGTPSNRMPSYEAMIEFASKDARTKKQIGLEKLQQMREDFGVEYQGKASDFDGPEGEWHGDSDRGEGETEDGEGTAVETPEPVELTPEDVEWMTELTVDAKGNYKSTIDNVRLILENDMMLKGKFALNKFTMRQTALGHLPWRKVSKHNCYLTDTDDAGLRHYVEKVYGIASAPKIQDALALVIEANSFHPVRDYLNGLVWDGKERVDTVLIDYLGAEDSKYVREVTRKTLVAAVSRIFVPGIKFDYVLVLVGKQGQGKSTLIRKLGRDWYSDSFSTVVGKEAFEQIQGVWLIEMGELAGLKKVEVNAIKHFISKQEDRYRVAYGRRVENFPRQCVFFGTINEDEFLTDPTGNRRFWPVDTHLEEPLKSDEGEDTGGLTSFDDLTETEVNQIWAEAMVRYKKGEKLYLDHKTENEARQVQKSHTESDERAGIIQSFLDTLITEDWNDKDIYNRRNYYLDEAMRPQGTQLRMRVSVAEIWSEGFGLKHHDMNKFNTKPIHDIMKGLPGWSLNPNPIEVKGYGRQRCYYRALNVGEGQQNASTELNKKVYDFGSL